MQINTEHKNFGGFKAVVKEFNMKKRSELDPVFFEIQKDFGADITGPAFCRIHYISSVTDGYLVEAGFPVDEKVDGPGKFKLIEIEKYDVISMTTPDGLNELGSMYSDVYGYAYSKGLISDEFVVEVYHDGKTTGRTELLFVEHPWNELFLKNCKQCLDEKDCESICAISDNIKKQDAISDKFEKMKKMIDIVDRNREKVKHDILTECAHKFPKFQLEKLRNTYLEAEKKGDDPVDAVVEFMKNDPGWNEPPVRNGNEIYSEKKPSDPKAYAEAKTDLERKKAYCFCPLIKPNIDKGMSKTYCYCGAGWYKQQWEAATNKEVRVEILTSILNGDDKCSFKVILPE
jgi:hypothetical protein